MKKILFILSVSIYCQSCQIKACNCEVSENVSIKNDSLLSKFFHSPHAKDYWEKLGEPRLFLQEKETYRLIFEPQIDFNMKVCVVQKKSNSYNFKVKYFYHRDHKYKLIKTRSISITKKEWQLLRNAFYENCFWTMPILLDDNSGILDGVQVYLEGFNPERNNCTSLKYHTVSRYSPSEVSKFWHICSEFEKLESKSNK